MRMRMGVRIEISGVGWGWGRLQRDADVTYVFMRPQIPTFQEMNTNCLLL